MTAVEQPLILVADVSASPEKQRIGTQFLGSWIISNGCLTTLRIKGFSRGFKNSEVCLS